MSDLGLGLGIAGGMYSSWQANKAAKRQAEAMLDAAKIEDKRIRELTEPYLQQARFAMPLLRQTVMSQLAPRLGQNDPFLAKEHEMNLQTLGRREKTSQAQMERLWGATGNVGRGRGEQLRIRQGAQEARNVENLQYGAGQRGYRESTANQFIAALSGMGAQGTAGLGPAVTGAGDVMRAMTGAAEARGAGAQGMWGDIGGMFGTVGGALQEKELLKWLQNKGLLQTFPK